MSIRRKASWAVVGLLLAVGRAAADPGPAMAAAAEHVAAP